MSADGSHLEFPFGTKNITFVEVHPMNIYAMFALNWFTGFRGGSHVKTMSADGGHLEFPIGTTNITFVEVHPMTTHATNQFNWPSGF